MYDKMHSLIDFTSHMYIFCVCVCVCVCVYVCVVGDTFLQGNQTSTGPAGM